MEGFFVSEKAETESQRYIDGEIDVDELVLIMLEHYGLV